MICVLGRPGGGGKNDEKPLCFIVFQWIWGRNCYDSIGFMCISRFWSVFGPVTNPKSLCFTDEMLCFGPTQGPPKGGPGAPPGGRFETPKSCKSIVFAVYLAMVTPKSL